MKILYWEDQHTFVIFKIKRLSLLFASYDQWIGRFKNMKNGTVYITIIPCFPFRFE